MTLRGDLSAAELREIATVLIATVQIAAVQSAIQLFTRMISC